MWDYLAQTEKNIVLYGRGNAAERIMEELAKRGKRPAGFFASQGFVRPKEFRGYPVVSYEEAKARFGKDMIVLLCFGSHRKDVVDYIKNVASETEFYAPDLPVVGPGLFTGEYARACEDKLRQVWEVLADRQSRLVFSKVIEYKLSGKIDCLFECETESEENWALLEPSKEDVFLDLGAYTGDTALEFVRAAGAEPRAMYCVEPEERNFRKLQETAKLFDNCLCINKAVSDSQEFMEFSAGGGRGSLQKKTRVVEADTVDHMFPKEEINVIKMDLEGTEAKAIAGARNVITRCRPRMLVSAYHRLEDLWALPLQVLEIRPDYRVYLRHSPCLPAWEINYFFK